MKRQLSLIALCFSWSAVSLAATPNHVQTTPGTKSAAALTTGAKPSELTVSESRPDPSLVAEVSRLVEASLEALRDRREHRHKSFLKESLAKLPQFAPARWHSGYVRFAGAWVHVDQVPYLTSDSPTLAKYAELREKADEKHYPKATTAEFRRIQLVDRKRQWTPDAASISVLTTRQGENGAAPVTRSFAFPANVEERLDTYADEKLRVVNSAGYSPGYTRAQESLARWCRDNGLPEEARVHWAKVLEQEPANDEAAKALGLVRFGGRYIPQQQLQRAKEQEREATRSLETYRPILAKLHIQAASPDQGGRQRALAELGSIDDANAVFALEKVALGYATDEPTAVYWRESAASASRGQSRRKYEEEFDRAVVRIIGKFDTQPATESLVRLAMRHGEASVRLAAGERLKGRDLRSFVPLLLDRLTMPIQYDVQIVENLLGEKQIRAAASQEFSSHLAGLRDARQISNGQQLRQLTAAAQAKAKQVQAFNRRAHENNARIAAALVLSVDIDREGEFRDLVFASELGTSDPKRWWEWWYDYNEQYVSSDKPYYGYDYGLSSFEDYRWSYAPVRPMSCFAKGTPVWTLSGKKPIEDVKIGDRVLAQHPETGELKYKGVLVTTIRPPSEMLTIRAGKSEITTTLGHPFFVAGKGWRMAKELTDTDWICAQGATLPIDAIEKAEPAGAHNLVIADFGTYFVGKDRVLVHDNSPIPPARLDMPGLLAVSD